MKSVMKHDFSRVPQADIPRSSFNRNHGHKTTMDGGWLVPIFCTEALPGSTHNLRVNLFGRLATPLVPTMDNLKMTVFFFSCPIRILWENWEKFMGQKENDDDTEYLVPQIVAPAGGWQVESLEDYFGLPLGIENLSVSAFYHRAYNKIWNDWFRPQAIVDSVTELTGDGPDDPTAYTKLKRAKRFDYFTSALPWPQKGPSVQLPLTGDANILGIGKNNQEFTANHLVYETGGDAQVTYANAMSFHGSAGDQLWYGEEDEDNPGWPNIRASMDTVTSATVSELRSAFQLQKLLERDSRSGTRYVETLMAHFKVRDPGHAVLQRPEYLGGGSAPLNITPVPQTGATTETNTPQGNLAGFGTVSSRTPGFTKSFTEHSIIMGMVCLHCDLTYQRGIDKGAGWLRRTKYDYYWPALSHLSEQTITNEEIFAQGPTVQDADGQPIDKGIFGYAERWSEYRYFNSKITGKFRSTDPQSLDIWHLSQDFGTTLPTLSEQFLMEDPPIDRIIAVQDEPHLLLDTYFEYTTAQPMPSYSVPGLIDHF